MNLYKKDINEDSLNILHQNQNIDCINHFTIYSLVKNLVQFEEVVIFINGIEFKQIGCPKEKKTGWVSVQFSYNEALDDYDDEDFTSSNFRISNLKGFEYISFTTQSELKKSMGNLYSFHKAGIYYSPYEEEYNTLVNSKFIIK